MTSVWHRIEAWLGFNAPVVLASLAPPASEAEIEALELLLGWRLPDDYRESLKIHNGQLVDPIDGSVPGFIMGYELLNCRRAGKCWDGWCKLLSQGVFEDIQGMPDGPVRSDWWNPAWIPVADSGHGDNSCIDMAPPPSGRPGQIISVWHDRTERDYLDESFSRFLASFVSSLEKGEYVFSEEFGAVIRAEDAD